MASLLATRGIENGALRSYFISLLGHTALAGLVFFLPGSRKKVFIEEIPRSVKLIARLEAPAPPAPRPVPRVQPKAAPPPAPSRVQVPSEKAPPLLKPLESRPEPESFSLKDKLSSRLSDLEAPPAQAPPQDVPRIARTEIRSLSVPSPTAPSVAFPPTEDLVPLSNFPFAWYIAIVKDKVFSGWRPPSSFSLGGRSLTAIASFRITRGGALSQISINEGSGHHLFDQSVLAALDSLHTLPALPKDYKEEHLDVVIRFQSPSR